MFVAQIKWWYLYMFLKELEHLLGEGDGTSLQYSCLENPMDRGAWWATVHGVARSRTRLSEFTFIFHFHALEKEMATHFSVLAWRISGTGEPSGLPSMGSHRVRHDWRDLAAAAAAELQLNFFKDIDIFIWVCWVWAALCGLLSICGSWISLSSCGAQA